MFSDTTCLPTLIEAGRSIRILDGKGTKVLSLEGSIWITQSGDPRDVILEPGQQFILDRNGLTLLVALNEPAVARIITAKDRSALKDFVSAGIMNAPERASPKFAIHAMSQL